jgi:hypothetical protein
MGAKIFTEEDLITLLDSSLDIDIEKEYQALTKQLNAINRKMFDAYRLSTFLVHANKSHKHPARTLITEASAARNEIPPSVRTLMGELEKQEARKAARLSTRKSKGAQPEDRHKQHPRARPRSRPSRINTPSAHGLLKQLQVIQGQRKRHVKQHLFIHYRRQRSTTFTVEMMTTTTMKPSPNDSRKTSTHSQHHPGPKTIT